MSKQHTSAAHVLGFLGDFGIGNVMEGDAAEASGMERRDQLLALQGERNCGPLGGGGAMIGADVGKAA